MEELCDFYREWSDRLPPNNTDVHLEMGLSVLREEPDGERLEAEESTWHRPHLDSHLQALLETYKDDTTAPALSLVWAVVPELDPTVHLERQLKGVNLVCEKLGLNTAFQYCYSLPLGIQEFPSSQGDGNDCTSFCVFSSGLFQLAACHDRRRGSTRAVLVGAPGFVPAMLGLLKRQRRLARHPMFLAILASTMLSRILDHDLLDIQTGITQVELRTRFHDWRDLGASSTSPGDHSHLLSRVSRFSTRLALNARYCILLRETMKFVADRQNTIEHDGFLRVSTQDTLVLSSEANTEKSLLECHKLIGNRVAMANVQLDFLERRVQTQMGVLMNLVAQKDANIGILHAKHSRILASASKRDSTAMKTLAAMTVIYLPGTFIASFFAMPLFDWNAPAVVNERFWVYWAVTLPLTAMTIAGWATWNIYQNRSRQIEDEQADEQWSQDIGDKSEMP